MKIAVPYDQGMIFQHFGHTAQFKVYTVEDGKVSSAQVVDTNGQGHGALAGLLKELDVQVLVCGGIGGGAQIALRENGVRIYGGVDGEADSAVTDLLNGALRYDADVKCSHHEAHHHEDHACGQHGCGGHCH